MAITQLSIPTPPDYIYVGETLGFNINTDGEITYLAMNPKDVVSINETRDKITGVQPGTVQFTIKAQRKGCEEATLVVNLRCKHRTTNTTSIMLHNRETNRVTSIKRGNDTSLTESTVKLPKNGTGTLITKEGMLDKFQFINKPVIIHPANGDTNCTGWILASTYSTNMGFQGAHEVSVWEYYSDSELKDLLDTRYTNKAYEIDGTTPGDITKGPIIHTNATVYVRVKYISGTAESAWSDPIQINTGDTTKDSKTTLLAGDAMLGYYGVVPHNECIDTRRYRGNYDTLVTAANNTSLGDYANILNFPIGEQVTKNGKLYHALKAMTNTTRHDPVTSVANNEGWWAVDTRENLPTPKWVNGVTGIGFGFTDSNNDGLSSGATSVGSIVDNELGWIKYSYRGRVCYTPVKPICTQLCWNDIAKREIAYGERTFRGGATQLYRIRLMREDEYTTVIPALMNGTLAKYTQAQLGLVDATNNTIARLTWLEDFQEGALRKVGDHTGTKIYQTDPKTRVGTLATVTGVSKWLMSYRPVIELVTSEEEPWRNSPICHEPSNQSEFQYDFYTDTGYYGMLSSSEFTPGDWLYASIGMTAGTSVYSKDTNWFKFYWHGYILYYSTHPLRYGVDSSAFLTNGVVYSADTGNLTSKSFSIDNNVVYKVCLPIGSRYTPYVATTDYTSATVMPGAYAHHIELFERVWKGSTSTFFTDTQGNCRDGYQVGDNWLSDSELVYDKDNVSADNLMSPVTTGNIAASWVADKTGWYSYILSTGGTIGVRTWYPSLKYPVSNHIWLSKNIEYTESPETRI